MNRPPMVLPRDSASPRESYALHYKRRKISSNESSFGSTASSAIILDDDEEGNDDEDGMVIDYSDPSALSNMLESVNSAGKYGNATKGIENLLLRRAQMLSNIGMNPCLSNSLSNVKLNLDKEASRCANRKAVHLLHDKVIELEDDDVGNDVPPKALAVVISDSDDEGQTAQIQKPKYTPNEAALQFQMLDRSISEYVKNRISREEKISLPGVIVNCKDSNQSPAKVIHKVNGVEEDIENQTEVIDRAKDKGFYLGVEEDIDNQTEPPDDCFGNIWTEMSMSMECSKDVFEDRSTVECMQEDGDCDHSFILKDDLGYVCRVCGIIEKRIETIIDIQYNKVKKSTRTYVSEPRNGRDKDSTETAEFNFSENDLLVTDICAHPRHMKKMKPHQVEGFNFLCSNLVAVNPGGCILAHAPGSGKTFMIISFMQSFMAKYPHAKPLVVLPKGILATWKKEFETWQVENIPLLDFYTVKADNRAQQLEVLKLWVQHKSILFLGYKQFSIIICDTGTSQLSNTCRDILLKAPTILILDEGHTPRNENTDVLQSIARVQTPRKVVLSGTLYQNHVKEVFNILNLVRPKFLRLDSSIAVVKRIMSKAHIPGVRKQFKAGTHLAFYDLVENTLQKDKNFERKVSVIHDLREMTHKVLHYYKGDFLEELPGLVDFTVVLNLSSRQKNEVGKLKNLRRKFRISSVGSAVYVHPKLSSFSMNSVTTDEAMDAVLNKIDVKDGVKAKFFLNMLNLCESAGEKLLVFSQYLIPLNFLERLAVKLKGWHPGREIFSITGESSSEHRELSMDQFNNSPDAKVFFGSIKACGEGISLVGASRIIILDVHLNPSVTRQAIGRAFRPGQMKKVHAYRLVAADSPEEEDHDTCFQKEVIAKMWFEWNEHCGYQDFEVKTVDVDSCDDLFMESPLLRSDVKLLYKR